MHDERYYDYVSDMWMDCGKESMKYTDCYYNEHSSRVALLAAEALKISVDKIMNKEWQNCFAAVRPPGHHAENKGRIAGFSFINNVAVAARYAQEVYGIKKIAIFDWDVHHGDGTQRKLEDDPSILFMSLHRYDYGFFYPGDSGSVENIGKGKGEGYNLNMPWNIVGRTDY